jgi:hypothetical protein
MVSLELRNVFYSAAVGAESILEERRKKLQTIEELEGQLKLVRKIVDKLEDKQEIDPSILVKVEHRVAQIEKQIGLKRREIEG